MDNLDSQILLFPHHLASTLNFDLVLPRCPFTAAHFSIRYYQTQLATSKCSVTEKGDFFSEVACDLPSCTHTRTAVRFFFLIR